MRSLVVSLALLTSAVPAHAKCAPMGQRPKVLTNGPIPTGAGLVVYTEPDASRDAGAPTGEAFQPTWVWKDATGTTTKPEKGKLAPGLVVYAVPPGVTAAELTDGTIVRATITVGPAAETTLPAPVVEKIGHIKSQTSEGMGAETRVELDEGVPKDAVAIVIYDAKSGKPLSYGTVSSGYGAVYVYSRRACRPLPKGTVEPKVKQKVTLRYVDRFGRLSPPTDVQTVVAMKGETYED